MAKNGSKPCCTNGKLGLISGNWDDKVGEGLGPSTDESGIKTDMETFSDSPKTLCIISSVHAISIIGDWPARPEELGGNGDSGNDGDAASSTFPMDTPTLSVYFFSTPCHSYEPISKGFDELLVIYLLQFNFGKGRGLQTISVASGKNAKLGPPGKAASRVSRGPHPNAQLG